MEKRRRRLKTAPTAVTRAVGRGDAVAACYRLWSNRLVPGCGTATGRPFLAGRPRAGLLGACPCQQETVAASPRNCRTRAGATVCRHRAAWRPYMRAAAGQEKPRIRRWNPGTYWAPGLGQLRVAAGHRLGVGLAQDCQSVRIYASDQYPRQDSNQAPRPTSHRTSQTAPSHRSGTPLL
jgi:hypothetical protein